MKEGWHEGFFFVSTEDEDALGESSRGERRE